MTRSSSSGAKGDPALLILISIADAPRHGHAMMRDIEDFSGQRLGPGTLYGAIERLETQGLIEPLETTDRRQPYRISERGERYLDEQLAALRALAALGSRRRERVSGSAA